MGMKQERWELGRKAMSISLGFCLVWGTALVVSATLFNVDNITIQKQFDACCFLIFSILAVMVGGKAWKEFAPMKWK